jgi:hypothetical protein
MKTDGEILLHDLIFLLTEEKTLHEEERYPLDRTTTIDRALKLLRNRDPEGQHRAYLVSALRRIIGSVAEADYYLEESLLQRLTAEDWFEGQGRP